MIHEEEQEQEVEGGTRNSMGGEQVEEGTKDFVETIVEENVEVPEATGITDFSVDHIEFDLGLR